MPFFSFTQELTLNIREGLWSNALSDAVVTIYSDTNSQTYKSDFRGNVRLNKAYVNSKIIVSHPSNNYKTRSFIFDGSSIEKSPIYLYPTDEFERSFPETRPIMKSEVPKEDTTSIVTYTEDYDHTFVGGYKALMAFFKDNTVYPIEAIQNKWEGKVSIFFLGEIDGSITRVTVVKSSGYEILDDEAKRIMRKSPKWTAPKRDGEFIRSYLRLPINFKLY